MFIGRKFEAVDKTVVSALVGFSPSVLDTYSEAVTGFINKIDAWAFTKGYEFHGFTEKCVIFKRIVG